MAAAQVTVPGLERLTQLATININQTSLGYYGSSYKVLSEGEVLFSLNEIVPDTIFQGGSRRSFIIDGVDNTGRKLQTSTKLNVGGVYKKYRGWTSDVFSFNDDYTITFPADLAVHYKLAVIVACVFIDFRFHEGK